MKLCRWLLSVVLCSAALAPAQQFPSKPIRLIVPFAAGGGADLVARTIRHKMSELLGQQVLVDNRPGAQGNTGTASAAKAAPDGYTLVLGETGTLCINPHLFADVGYDPQKDFSPIALMTRQPYLIVVQPAIPVASVREFVAYAKAGNKVTAGTSGAAGQIATELFRLGTGTDVTGVPYKSGGLALFDLLGGHISMTITTPAPVLPFIRDGKLRVLAVTTRSRADVLPNVPTVAEGGIPDYDIAGWYGILAPAKTPREIVRRLNAELVRVAQLPEVRDPLTREGAQVAGSSPEEFVALIRSEFGKWGKAVQRTGVRAGAPDR